MRRRGGVRGGERRGGRVGEGESGRGGGQLLPTDTFLSFLSLCAVLCCACACAWQRVRLPPLSRLASLHGKFDLARSQTRTQHSTAQHTTAHHSTANPPYWPEHAPKTPLGQIHHHHLLLLRFNLHSSPQNPSPKTRAPPKAPADFLPLLLLFLRPHLSQWQSARRHALQGRWTPREIRVHAPP